MPRMPKGGVAQVMGQRYGLHQVFVQMQMPRHRTTELRHFQRMRQSRAKKITFMVRKNLGLVDQSPKGCAVNNAVTISLMFAARRGAGFDHPASARMFWVQGPWRQIMHGA